MNNKININLYDVIGGGYKRFWNYKGRYRVIKGSRASKKSRTAALWYIWNMMKCPDSNLLVVRKVFRTIKDSCFTTLKWAISRLSVMALWDVKESPLEMTFRRTGQKIYFRGLDDPMKITSITSEVGYLCWMWIEEAYEISREDDFNSLDEAIRGEVAGNLFKQITLTFNPWNQKHWLKSRFFDAPSDDVLALTTNYTMNEWLDSADLALFEAMKANNPRRYQVAGIGNWGIVEGVIYENWIEQQFDIDGIPGLSPVFGLDFGYTNDPSALFCGGVDIKNKVIYVYDEMYEYGLSNEAIYSEVRDMGYSRERIIADSAEPKSIDRLMTLGMQRIRPARKGRDSVKNGIDYIQGYRIIVHPRCVNFLTEIGNYTWDEDKSGKKLNRPIDDFNHLMDAMRYAMEGISKGKSFGF